MKKNDPWLKRPLMPMPVYAAVFFTAKDFHAELKRLGIGLVSFTEKNSDACVHTFENEHGVAHHYMCIDLAKMAKMNRSGSYVMGTIVHECVHVWQRICNYLGEHEPSREFEAYAVQHIFFNVMEKLEEHDAKSCKHARKAGRTKKTA